MSQRVYESMSHESMRVSAVTQTHKMKANPNPKLLLYSVSLAHDSLTHLTHKTISFSVNCCVWFWLRGHHEFL